MKSEAITHISGVGALIVPTDIIGNSFVTIVEQDTKRNKNKLRGMRSLPMETVEKEENHRQAIKRLFTEEVVIIPSILDGGYKLCECEIWPNVVLHAYLFEVDCGSTIALGSYKHEVSAVGWTKIDDIISTPKGSLRFRPGVFEVISSYLNYLADPQNFHFQVFSYNDLRNSVPVKVFDYIESGLSEREALSRFDVAPQLLPDFGVLDR